MIKFGSKAMQPVSISRIGRGGKVRDVGTHAKNVVSAFFDTHEWLRYAYRKFRGVPGVTRFAEWLKRPYIGRDGRVRFNKVGLDICEACNIRCEHCTHFSPFRGAIHSKEELIGSLERWGKRIVPRELSILGGEPFLHPSLAEIVVAARKAFYASRIVIIPFPAGNCSFAIF